MIKVPEGRQDLSEAGIRANIEYLMARQTKRVIDHSFDKDEIARWMAKLDLLKNKERENNV